MIGVDFVLGLANIPEKKWVQYKKTYTIRDDMQEAYFNFNIIRNGTYWVSSPKIEYGDTVTPWCPNVADASYDSELANTIYDISGFENNGEMINKPSFNSDSIIGKYSLYCGENQYVVAQNTNVDKIFNNEFTISTWVKITNLINTFQGIMFYGVGDTLKQVFILKSNSYSPPKFAFSFFGSDLVVDEVDPLNNWVHLVLTYKEKTKKVYVNGEYYGAQTDSAVLNVPENLPLYVGRGRSDSYPLLGFIDDFRIYATALSSDDIKRLYNERIKVDNIGNVYCSELNEEERIVEYLESTGTQCINTGYIPNKDTRIYIDFMFTELNTSKWNFLFGGRQEGGAKEFSLVVPQNSSYFRTDYGETSSRINTTTSAMINVLYKIDKNKNVTTISNGTTIDSYTNSIRDFTSPVPLYLFVVNNSSGYLTSEMTTGRIYKCKIYDNGILVRDFLPTISTEDGHIGEPCLFDTVENKYYYNQGTGTFKTNLTDSETNVNVTDKGMLNCRYLIEGNDPAKILQDENIVKVNEIKEN